MLWLPIYILFKAYKLQWFNLHARINHRLTVIDVYKRQLKKKEIAKKLNESEKQDLIDIEKEVESLQSHFDEMQ